jgi:hypothetical protein
VEAPVATTKRNWTDGFYWIGVALTLGCFALVLAGNTEFGWTFEHSRFPVSWILGGAAVATFLVADVCHRAFSHDVEEAPVQSESLEAKTWLELTGAEAERAA